MGAVDDSERGHMVLGIWRVELEGFSFEYESNITVAEVVARHRAEAEETALSAAHLGGKTPRELGAKVKSARIFHVLYPGLFLQWLGNSGGLKF